MLHGEFHKPLPPEEGDKVEAFVKAQAEAKQAFRDSDSETQRRLFLAGYPSVMDVRLWPISNRPYYVRETEAGELLQRIPIESLEALTHLAKFIVQGEDYITRN